MLDITVPAAEWWDERTESFLSVPETALQLEHSLVSISKWEAKWNKAFLGKKEKTSEELLDYVRCMTLTQGVDPQVYLMLTDANIQAINRYIEAPMTATRFPQDSKKTSHRETATSELIYYWMVSFRIPFECQYWHLNRLLALINVCSLKNQPPKKVGKNDLRRRGSLNAERRKRLNTKG